MSASRRTRWRPGSCSRASAPSASNICRTARRRRSRAGREVILSGGSINSPQLLQLSGVGPAALLGGARHSRSCMPTQNVGAQSAGPCRHQLHLQGQLPTLNQMLRPWWGKLLVGMQYLLMRSGPLSLSMNHAGGFFRTDPALDAAQHAALFPGLLDRHPEERRAPDPDARSVAGLLHRPVQLPAVQPRRDHDPLEQSARLLPRSSPTPIRPMPMSPRCWRR